MRAVRSMRVLTAIGAFCGMVASATVVHAAVTVDIGTATGAAAATVSVAVSLNGTDATHQVVAFANQFGFDPATPIAANGQGKPDCALASGIVKDNTGFSFQPRNCVVGTSCTSVKAAVISFNPNNAKTPLPNGVIYTCNFAIPGAATNGTVFALTTVAVTVTDQNNADTDVTSTSASGGVTVGTVGATSTPTSTPTSTNTPVPATNTPTIAPTTKPTSTATIKPTSTATSPPAPTSSGSFQDEDGCQIGARGSSSVAWLLIVPVAVVLVRRRKHH